MMMDSQFLEKVWGEILSRRPARIQRMFTTLDPPSQKEVLEHLKKNGNRRRLAGSADYQRSTCAQSFEVRKFREK